MASFDPSVLSDISGPDVAGSMAKGLQLKDLMDTTKLNELKLANEKQEMTDRNTIRGILSQGMDTPEKAAQVQEQLTRAGHPDIAMNLRKEQQAYESGQMDQRMKVLQLHSATQEIITGSVDRVWQQATAMKDAKRPDGRPQYTDASINAFIQGQIPSVIDSIRNDETLPDDVRKLALQNVGGVLQKTGGAVTYDQLTAFERQTKQGQAMLKEHLNEMNVQSEMRHRGVEEGQKAQELGIKSQELGIRQKELEVRGREWKTALNPEDKKPHQVLLDDNGNVVTWGPEVPQGRGEHPTESENKAAVNYTTMANAEEVLDKPQFRDMNMAFLSTVEEDKDGYLHAVGRFGRKRALTPDEQVVAQAARQFAEGAGHLKSGARINRDTMALMVDLYLPLPGDSPELQARKRQARRNDLAAGKVGAGRALEGAEKVRKEMEGPQSDSEGKSTQPFSDPEKEKRYQAWKAAHPNG